MKRNTVGVFLGIAMMTLGVLLKRCSRLACDGPLQQRMIGVSTIWIIRMRFAKA